MRTGRVSLGAAERRRTVHLTPDELAIEFQKVFARPEAATLRAWAKERDFSFTPEWIEEMVALARTLCRT